MIRLLYKQYRAQIVFAFLLVIFENVAYIAEPYVFGRAIDGLREAHQIEEEVDSSITTMTLRQVADSVRAHVLDSLRIDDSLKKLRQGPPSSLLEPEAAPAPERPAIVRPAIDHYRSSTVPIFEAVYYSGRRARAAETDTSLLPPPGTPERAALDSLKRALARHDSIRKEIKARPPAPVKPVGSDAHKTDRPLAFYVTREVGPFLPPLLPWVLLFIINSSLGAFRRIYDTRVYTRMFANLSSDVVSRQLAQGEELSKVAARSTMSWHNIEFFQYNVPEFLEQLIAVSGAIIALGLFDWRLTVAGATLVVLVTIGSRYYMRALAKIQKRLNDWHEQEINIYSTREPARIKQYFTDISELEIKYSLRSTFSYSVIRFFLLFMFLSTLYISIDLDRFTIGALYSIVAYVWSFVTATEYIPYLSEKWVQLRDTSRRIADTLPTEE